MGAVDVWSQITTDRFMQAPWLDTLFRWTGQTERRPVSVETTLAAMDAAEVDVAMLSAWCGPCGWLISNGEVAENIAHCPARFAGLASADLNDPMRGVREIRRCAANGFVGVRIVPWLWDLPPNDRRYYPIYATCVDLNLPFCTQIGHTGPLRRSEPGRPIPYLEDVLLDFPELRVIGGHVGVPWIEEVLSLARKFPNFYIDTSAYAVHRLPRQLIDFMRGDGRGRVMFGSNWPMLPPSRCLERLDELGLDADARAQFLGAAARRVFRLDQKEGSRAA